MSEVEYKRLLSRISKRLDDTQPLKDVLDMCRGKLPLGADDTIRDTHSLFIKLEENNFLGIDSLQMLKDLVKAAGEWDLKDDIDIFESERGKYKELLERVIGVLEELSDLERLMSIVWRRRRIPEERKNGVHDVRSLVQELEDRNYIGVAV